MIGVWRLCGRWCSVCATFVSLIHHITTAAAAAVCRRIRVTVLMWVIRAVITVVEGSTGVSWLGRCVGSRVRVGE